MISPRATIRIHNLSLRTIIGANPWERTSPQDVIINLAVEFDPTQAIATDALDSTLNYKALKRALIEMVEKSSFNLVERLTSEILRVVMADPRALRATVKVDKPHALRFADSVSVEMSAERAA